MFNQLLKNFLLLSVIVCLCYQAVDASSTGGCDTNEEYTNCGTACEPSCDVPRPEFCTAQCILGCQCKSGFLRNSDGKCCLKGIELLEILCSHQKRMLSNGLRRLFQHYPLKVSKNDLDKLEEANKKDSCEHKNKIKLSVVEETVQHPDMILYTCFTKVLKRWYIV
uniref:TIL domain-containing protein n=1 Tax=Glossina brevipalpis TaxID=37001 RepID=A0A1A9X4E6_9MUSC